MRTEIIPTPRIIPVIDLKGGLAVHAVGGERSLYKPVRSVLHSTPDPLALARAFRDRLGLQSLYLADLDAIVGAPRSLALYQSLAALGIDLWVDAGLRDASTAPALIEAGVTTLVAGLESLAGPSALAELLDCAGAARVVLSLDLKDGRPLVAPSADWPGETPDDIVAEAVRRGVRRLLLLDLARVGRGGGLGTLPLLEKLAARRPGLEINVGGGIARLEQIAQAGHAGASAVLVGSALHDGTISIFS